MNRITTLDEGLFECVDNEATAYFLGLIYSDGNVNKSKNWNSYAISLTQSEKDLDIVINFKEALKTNKKISETTIKGKKYYSIYVYSEKIFRDLEKLGVFPNKSLLLTFPSFIPENLMPHFIRGYFDGDGCIWDGKRKKMLVKKENHPGEMRKRIVHNVKFNITGSRDFIEGLQEYLIKVCGFSKTKINYSKSKMEHAHGTMEYSGRRNITKFYNYIYENATIFGNRKKNIFEQILKDRNENYSIK